MCFILDDLHHISSDDLEEMDILHQLALLSIRTNKFYKRSGRKFPGLNSQTKVGIDKSKLRCHKCQKLGHFSRECRSSSYNQQPGNPSNSSFNRHQGTQGSAHFVPTHYIQTQAPPPPVQYVPQVQYVQLPPQPQGQQPPNAAQTASTPQPAHQSFFTSGYVDWSSLPNDMSEYGHDMGVRNNDVNWGEPESSQQNFALMAFEASTSSGVSHVSQASLNKLCSPSCIEAFALIR